MDKKELRKIVKSERQNVFDKAEKDRLIISNVKSLGAFKEAETVLCYLSLDDEIKTDELIDYSIEAGKKVAVPYCVDGEGNMEFYLINSISDTEIGSFNVREPDINKCEKLLDFNGSIIIVPGLCFNSEGHRLGYGKGYYDRFLKNYSFISVGLCYNSFIKNNIPVDVNDIAVDIVISENEVLNINNGGKNG